MQTPGTLADGRPIANGYGMGLSAGTYRGAPTVSHGGALAGYRTNLLRLPAEKLTVVTLCNNGTANAARLAQMVAELYAPAAMSAAPAMSGNAPLQAPARMVPHELLERSPHWEQLNRAAEAGFWEVRIALETERTAAAARKC